ncbi:gas vesicle protein [Desulfocucumis palustris]|uniref:Gas vesicle protein n=1 Tax=Desulfocucumis palustris TaxID=1898651 RepID=A0A2L2X8E6_9FIRM|nr:gas vesicle protein GvpJ [Desulfocucumis palustris]GBF32445.1 gas vesicle protein [Desulfocucumis palustris]
MKLNSISREKDVTLLELLDLILDKGVVISGDIIISVADVDLVYLGLRVVLASLDKLYPPLDGEV